MENNNDIIRNHHQPPPPPPLSSSYSQQPSHTASFEPVSQEERQQQLKSFWLQQMETIEDFKTHKLPLAPIVFAKACEMFVVDLTTRSWRHAEENKRRTLHKSDISNAVAGDFAFDFLLDVVPRDESLDGGVVPYYFPPEFLAGYPVVGGRGMYGPQAWPAANGDGEDEAGKSGGNSCRK